MSGEELRVLAEEQAALRRLATLVARGAPPEEVFAAVVEEVGRLVPVEFAGIGRFEPDGKTFTVIATSSAVGDSFAVGGRWPLLGRRRVLRRSACSAARTNDQQVVAEPQPAPFLG